MALKFLKIDLIRVKRFWYMLLICFAVLALLGKRNGMPGLFGLGYCLFIGIIMSTFPANLESGNERGFLQMLPAKPGEDIKGHFLFAAVCTLVFTVIAFVLIAAARAINPSLPLFNIEGVSISGLYPVLIGLALVFSGIELLLLTVFRYKSVQMQQLLRLIPAFVFFFGANLISDRTQEMRIPDLSFGMKPLYIAILTGCIIVFIALAEISARISTRRK